MVVKVDGRTGLLLFPDASPGVLFWTMKFLQVVPSKFPCVPLVDMEIDASVCSLTCFLDVGLDYEVHARTSFLTCFLGCRLDFAFRIKTYSPTRLFRLLFWSSTLLS